ncbi:NADH-quinone oxidoreductase subunit M [Fontisphaera persica]|uniref:complex I subunit 4 family protein n=1 Tax=Fontisphaera persica TaxID=2974023 RepID=UPI0024BFDA1C|nr:NADH-quinone oxidoreductase subunit M [Fontisphaera persica]WCJ59297.1 NADH-quinone oxidoreductase subunit M [Fontisphaera persica]
MEGWLNLTVLTLTPLAGAAVVLLGGGGCARRARYLAMTAALAVLAEAMLLWNRFDPLQGGLQLVERYAWVPSLGVYYYVGADGLSLLMLLLTALVTPLAILCAQAIQEKAALYFGLVLLLEAGLVGAFTAMNFFHWFLFWELTLIPAFFLIKLWGGPGRGPAAMQFFVYTMVGSVTLLLAMLGLFRATGQFDFPELARMGRSGELYALVAMHLPVGEFSPRTVMLALFGGVFLGFAIKTPVAPFHTWLPAAYAEAPTSTTMLLTGLMSKLGVYGLLRLALPIFPHEVRALGGVLLGLAVATVVLSAFTAFAQRDLKRLLGYSSINHLGYCVLGMVAATLGTAGEAGQQAAALNGVLLQMFNHGLTAATLFAAVGWLEERAGGRRGLDDFGGLRRVAPVYAGLTGMAWFASLGLPGLNGFVGEFLIFKGVFGLAPWAAAFSTLGLLATAVVILTVLQRVFHGPLNAAWETLADLTPGERLRFVPAVALMLFLGVWPAPVMNLINETVLRLAAHLQG